MIIVRPFSVRVLAQRSSLRLAREELGPGLEIFHPSFSLGKVVGLEGHDTVRKFEIEVSKPACGVDFDGLADVMTAADLVVFFRLVICQEVVGRAEVPRLPVALPRLLLQPALEHG